MAPSWNVSGRTVLITGAARGIGAECARRLSAEGARVALVGLEPDELAAVAASCGPEAAWFEADVTDTDELEQAVEAAVERFGGIDAVIANAGIGGGGPLRHADPRLVRARDRGEPARRLSHPPSLHPARHRSTGLRTRDRLHGGRDPRARHGCLHRQQGGRRGDGELAADRGQAPRCRRGRGLPLLDRHRDGAWRGPPSRLRAHARQAPRPSPARPTRSPRSAMPCSMGSAAAAEWWWCPDSCAPRSPCAA